MNEEVKTEHIKKPKEEPVASLKNHALHYLRDTWNFVTFVLRSFYQNQGLENSKSLTFTSLFAVVPLLTLTVVLLAAFPAFQSVGSQVEEAFFSSLPPSYAEQIQQYLEGFSSKAKNITLAGVVMLVVTAYLMLVSIERNLNQIWGIGEQRKGLASFLLYWSVLSLGPLLLGAGFAVSSYITSLSLFQRVTEVGDVVGITRIALTIFPILVTTMAFTLLYVAVPNCGVKIRHAAIGALVVAISFTLVKEGFTWFISVASYQLVYGSFAALPIFLIWIYICWVVILLGANLVRCLPLYQKELYVQELHPSILVMALLHNFWEAHQYGKGIHVQNLVQAHWPFKSLRIDDYLDCLVEQKLIRAVDEDEYVLARDLKGVPLWEVLRRLPWAPVSSVDFRVPIPEVLKPHLPILGEWQAQVEGEEQRQRGTYGTSLDEIFRKEALQPATDN